MSNSAPDSDGDWETYFNYPMGAVCANPTAIKATPLDGGALDVYHLHLDFGFYCLNSEQNDGNICADFEVQLCCPKTQNGHCDIKGYEWTDSEFRKLLLWVLVIDPWRDTWAKFYTRPFASRLYFKLMIGNFLSLN